MNDIPRPVPADDAALLAAYLDAELAVEDADALEARLASEPALAAELEVQRELRELLGGVATPEPPDGFADRLSARLDAERAELASTRPPVTSLASERERRRPINWGAMGGIAAALVAVAVFGAAVLTQGGGADMALDSGGVGDDAGEAERFYAETDTDDSVATEEADEAQDSAMPESEPTDEAADEAQAFEPAQGDTAEGGEDGRSSTSGTQLARPTEPVIVSDGVDLADEEAVRAHLSGRPEAEGLLGMDGQEATDTAASFRVAVQRAEPFPSGVRPDACLDTVAGGTEGTIAPVRVEEVVFDGAPSLLYLLVVAGDDGTFADVEGWVVAPDSCATGLFVNLT